MNGQREDFVGHGLGDWELERAVAKIHVQGLAVHRDRVVDGRSNADLAEAALNPVPVLLDAYRVLVVDVPVAGPFRRHDDPLLTGQGLGETRPIAPARAVEA